MSSDFDTDILIRLRNLQQQSSNLFPRGVFPSYRYHTILPYRRADDNVYFTSSILIVLKKIQPFLNKKQKEIASEIIREGEQGISNYESRLGNPVYNFYRSDNYFPNGNMLSKFKIFQPTDDTDDTAIAYRGKSHKMEQAKAAKEILSKHANGQREIWNKRSLKKYQKSPVYNTWIGSKKLYVDIDVCVIANALTFTAVYKLPIDTVDRASISFLENAILSGDYIDRKYKISAWYPFDAVIFFQITELIEKTYFTFSDKVRDKITNDILTALSTTDDLMSKILLTLSLHNLNPNVNLNFEFLNNTDIDSFVQSTDKFSFGVIPLLHPFRGNIFQQLSTSKLFHLVYDCQAQRLALLLQLLTVKKNPHSR